LSWLELRVPPPVVAALFALLMWFAAAGLPVADFPLPAKGVLAGAFAAVGLALGLIAVFQFRKAATTIHPMKPQESSALVVGGVYSYTRNPMYLGMLLILAAWRSPRARILAAAIAIPQLTIYSLILAYPLFASGLGSGPGPGARVDDGPTARQAR